jgi:hypothetical protein
LIWDGRVKRSLSNAILTPYAADLIRPGPAKKLIDGIN